MLPPKCISTLNNQKLTQIFELLLALSHQIQCFFSICKSGNKHVEAIFEMSALKRRIQLAHLVCLLCISWKSQQITRQRTHYVINTVSTFWNLAWSILFPCYVLPFPSLFKHNECMLATWVLKCCMLSWSSWACYAVLLQSVILVTPQPVYAVKSSY